MIEKISNRDNNIWLLNGENKENDVRGKMFKVKQYHLKHNGDENSTDNDLLSIQQYNVCILYIVHAL